MKFELSVFSLILVLSLTACKTKDSFKLSDSNKNAENAEVVKVEIKGYAQITEAGEQDAYDRALKHGFRKAVEKILGTIIQSKTKIENSVLIKDEIMVKSEGFVKNFKVLSQQNQSGTKYLKMMVWVTKNDIKDDLLALGILNDDVGRPTLLVVTDESKMNKKPSEIIKNHLYGFFKKRRFRFIDVPNSLFKTKNQNNFETEMSHWGIQNGAQILIMGSAQSEEQKINYFENTGFKSVKSKVIIKAIYTGDGEVITSKMVTSAASAPNLQVAQDNSIEKALANLSPELLNAIIEHWKEASSEGFEYEISISGISFSEAKLIKDAMESRVEGIKKVFEKNYQKNKMNYLVRYTGLSSQLAGMLILKRKTQVPLELIELNNKRLELKKINILKTSEK